MSTSLSIGIVGLPNVGKSTLFNAFLKRQQALSANYPFATIDPNIGVVDVYDERVDKLAEISQSEKKVYTNITFVDIAGIVEGAHKGEGLGNQFLANIREVDLLLVLLRDFNDENIVREGSKNPVSDYQTILTELILKDLETMESQAGKAKKKPENKAEEDFNSGVKKISETLNKNLPASQTVLTEDEEIETRRLHLLTNKPILKLLNVDEGSLKAKFEAVSQKEAGKHYSDFDKNVELVVSAQIESELATLADEDRELYLKDLGLSESPLNFVIKVCYGILGLQTFLTSGVKESRAWKFRKGMNAKECAGVIHTDFENNFIKAEVIKYEDYVNLGGKNACKEAGKLRLEGKEYLMQDGDVVEFRVGV